VHRISIVTPKMFASEEKFIDLARTLGRNKLINGIEYFDNPYTKVQRLLQTLKEKDRAFSKKSKTSTSWKKKTIKKCFKLSPSNRLLNLKEH
jgi:hypothetical protein